MKPNFRRQIAAVLAIVVALIPLKSDRRERSACYAVQGKMFFTLIGAKAYLGGELKGKGNIIK